MKKYIKKIVLAFIIVLSINSYSHAKYIEEFHNLDNKIIKKVSEYENEIMKYSINQYEISNFLLKKQPVAFDKFNLLNNDIKNMLEKDKFTMPHLVVKKGGQVKTLVDDIFLGLDYLTYENGLYNHLGKYEFMDGNLLLEKNGKVEKITTIEENNLKLNNKFNVKKYDGIKYEKNGTINLNKEGYYHLLVTDSYYNHIDSILIEVVKEDINPTYDIEFKDVLKTDWFYKDVKEAVKLVIIKGKENNMYEPNANLSVAEAITLSSKLRAKIKGENFIEGGSNWYDNAVDYSIRNGVIKQGDFEDYTRAINRDEMAYIFGNTLDSSYYDKISDENINIPDIAGNRYSTEITLLYNAGILKGKDDSGNYYPKEKIIRSEVATILNRLANKSNRIK